MIRACEPGRDGELFWVVVFWARVGAATAAATGCAAAADEAGDDCGGGERDDGQGDG